VSKFPNKKAMVDFLLKVQQNDEEALVLQSPNQVHTVGLSGPDRDFYEITSEGLAAMNKLGNQGFPKSYFNLLHSVTGATTPEDLTKWYLKASTQQIKGLHQRLTLWAQDYAENHLDEIAPLLAAPDEAQDEASEPHTDSFWQDVEAMHADLQFFAEPSPNSVTLQNPSKTHH